MLFTQAANRHEKLTYSYFKVLDKIKNDMPTFNSKLEEFQMQEL